MIAASQPEIWNNSKQSKWDDEELSNRIWGFSDFFRSGEETLHCIHFQVSVSWRKNV